MPSEKKVMIEVPAELADAVKQVGEVLERSLAEIRRESGFDWEKISSAVEAATSEIEREATRRLLQECDVDAEAIRINGKRHSFARGRLLHQECDRPHGLGQPAIVAPPTLRLTGPTVFAFRFPASR